MGFAEGGEEPPPLAGGIAATMLTLHETPQQDSGFPKHFNKMKSMGVVQCSSFFQIGLFWSDVASQRGCVWGQAQV